MLNGLRTYKCNMCSVFILYIAFKDVYLYMYIYNINKAFELRNNTTYADNRN